MATNYDLIVIGGGPSGLTAAITAARKGKQVLILEKLPQAGAKLKASGGGRCNLSNTKSPEDFTASFGRNGRFMNPALEAMSSQGLLDFLQSLGVKCHAPDGFRIFPVSHQSESVLKALLKECKRLKVKLRTSEKAEGLLQENQRISGVRSAVKLYPATHVILAAGGRGYPGLGSEGDGYIMARESGHKVLPVYPAMLPLYCKETWVKHCTADTIGKAEIRINLPKYKKMKAKGDLIFTQKGIRGPVVLDFAREITPLLASLKEVPIQMNLIGGLNADQLLRQIKKRLQNRPSQSLLVLLKPILPESVAREICLQAGASPESSLKKLPGPIKDTLLKLLTQTPLTLTGHGGWDQAMVTRGGVSLKDIRPETLESKHLKGLYFCGEIVDLDGPCGGYNLQWAFSSGYLAGHLH